MKVKEAKEHIKTLERAENNLQKLVELSDEELESIAEKLGMNQSIVNVVNLVVDATKNYINILQAKIDNAKID